MKRCLGILLATAAWAQTATAAQFTFPGHNITVPDGFEVTVAAKTPLVDRPITADFDEQGRLYIADSSGMTEKADRQLQDKPHRIVRLEDTDGDGVFDKTIVFADKMMFPEGTMWYNGSLYVAAPPSIWKLTDTDNDGVADKREEWFEGKTLTGCANDLHGPYAGPDGWIYWCKGAFARQSYPLPNGKMFESRAAHIFRCRPDGTGREPVMTGGMDNPVDVVFTAEGERIFTTTFLQRPDGGRRDGLIHAIYGGLYGKVNDVLEDHKHTGELMPVLAHLGPAAPSGLARYESRGLGDDFAGNLFSTQFNLRRVQRHVLETDGGTFKTRDTDFFVSDNPDFHATDVIEDADGSLLVIDTGGWYRICCPTSQIAKPDVLGAVYRVRRKGAAAVADPRGLKLDWKKMNGGELVKLLNDERSAVRKRAIAQLGAMGGTAVSALSKALKTEPVETRRNAVWALTRIETAAAKAAVRTALADKDVSVQQTALHAVSLNRDAGAVKPLVELLKSSAPHVQRTAAEALGRIGAKPAVPALLAASATAPDRVMEHAYIYALIEINDPAGTKAGLESPSAATRSAALIALDQMDDGGLKSAQVTPLLTSADAKLKAAATWIAGRHPEWGMDLQSFFYSRLRAASWTDGEREELARQLAIFAHGTVFQEFMAYTMADARTSTAAREILLQGMVQAGLKTMPAPWLREVQFALNHGDEAVVKGGIALIRSLPMTRTNANSLVLPLLRVANNPARPAALRLDALAALPGSLGNIDPALFKFLQGGLDATNAPLQRAAAAIALGRAKLSEEQLIALAESVKAAGPMELTKLLSAYDGAQTETVGLKLVEALRESKGASALRADLLKPRFAKYPPAVQKAGEELMQRLSVDAEKQRTRLDQLATGLVPGDKGRGHLVFNNTKAACATCHAIGYLGGKVGPDLTKVGAIRTERDLLEAIVFPSASFVRNYEPMTIVTKDGEDRSGVIRSETADGVVLVSGLAVEQRIARTDIVEMRPGAVSLMPEGLDQQLTPQELADLIAFLRSLK